MTDTEKLKRLAASYRKAGKLMEAKAVERAQLIQTYRENMPAMIELAEVFAVELFAKYRAYVKAGFTEQQAIELCCKRP